MLSLQFHEFILNKNIYKFFQIKKNGYVYTLDNYTRATTTCSKFVKYYANNHEKYGLIKYYLKLSNCDEDCKNDCSCDGIYLAVIRKKKF